MYTTLKDALLAFSAFNHEFIKRTNLQNGKAFFNVAKCSSENTELREASVQQPHRAKKMLQVQLTPMYPEETRLTGLQ